MQQRRKENIMSTVRKYLLGMLYQRAEILAEYEPSAVIRMFILTSCTRFRKSG